MAKKPEEKKDDSKKIIEVPVITTHDLLNTSAAAVQKKVEGIAELLDSNGAKLVDLCAAIQKAASPSAAELGLATAKPVELTEESICIGELMDVIGLEREVMALIPADCVAFLTLPPLVQYNVIAKVHRNRDFSDDGQLASIFSKNPDTKKPYRYGNSNRAAHLENTLESVVSKRKSGKMLAFEVLMPNISGWLHYRESGRAPVTRLAIELAQIVNEYNVTNNSEAMKATGSIVFPPEVLLEIDMIRAYFKALRAWVELFSYDTYGLRSEEANAAINKAKKIKEVLFGYNFKSVSECGEHSDFEDGSQYTYLVDMCKTAEQYLTTGVLEAIIKNSYHYISSKHDIVLTLDAAFSPSRGTMYSSPWSRENYSREISETVDALTSSALRTVINKLQDERARLGAATCTYDNALVEELADVMIMGSTDSMGPTRDSTDLPHGRIHSIYNIEFDVDRSVRALEQDKGGLLASGRYGSFNPSRNAHSWLDKTEFAADEPDWIYYLAALVKCGLRLHRQMFKATTPNSYPHRRNYSGSPEKSAFSSNRRKAPEKLRAELPFGGVLPGYDKLKEMITRSTLPILTHSWYPYGSLGIEWAALLTSFSPYADGSAIRGLNGAQTEIGKRGQEVLREYNRLVEEQRACHSKVFELLSLAVVRRDIRLYELMEASVRLIAHTLQFMNVLPSMNNALVASLTGSGIQIDKDHYVGLYHCELTRHEGTDAVSKVANA